MLMEVEEQAKTASEILLFVVDEKTRGVASMVEIGYLLGTRTITPVHRRAGACEAQHAAPPAVHRAPVCRAPACDARARRQLRPAACLL